MTEKSPRPASLVGGANRAGGGIPGQGFQLPNSSFDPQTLAAALKHGATLYIGKDDSPFEFDAVQTLLGDTFPFDDTYRRDQTCFGLDYPDIPLDAVLAGLVWQGFQVERVKPRDTPIFNWAANIRSIAYLGHDRHGFPKKIRLSDLGVRGVLPAIGIRYEEAAL
jgi:hypothetical protein